MPEALVIVQLVVDEAHHGQVELEEREHDAVVHVLGKGLRQGMRGEPRHFLPVNTRLVVDALDGNEHLAKGVGLGDIGLKLQRQGTGAINHLFSRGSARIQGLGV